MNSLSKKIIFINLAFLLAFSITSLFFVYFTLKNQITTRAFNILEAVAHRQTLRLDSELENLEFAVKNLETFAISLYDKNKFADKNDRAKYTTGIKNLAQDIAKNTKNALSVFYRYNTDIFDKEGFFLIKKDDKFVSEELSDFADLNDADAKWYSNPKESKKPTWTSPYYSKNLDLEVIAYSIPVFYADEFIGVIGIEADFSAYLKTADKTKIYKNPEFYLLDVRTNNLYKNDKKIEKINIKESFLADIASSFENQSKNDSILEASYKNTSYQVSFNTTKNDMKFIISVPKYDIYLFLYEIMFIIAILSILALVVFAILSYKFSVKITKPLNMLVKSAQNISKGNFITCISCKTNDEIGLLANAMIKMMDKIEQDIKEINQLAYKDDLTQVGNKTAYTNYLETLNNKQYAVVIFDVNNLKFLNDNYGHQQGDELIKMAARYICAVFKDSLVFRIGGDEFVSILIGQDYENRYELLEHFEKNMNKNKLDIEPFSELSIAFGMADNAACYDETFKIADKNMYRKKQIMKK